MIEQENSGIGPTASLVDLSNTSVESERNPSGETYEESIEDVESHDDLTFGTEHQGPVFTDDPSTELTSNQCLTLFMSFVMKHQISGLALSDLLLLINMISPGCLPKTKYFIEKDFF